VHFSRQGRAECLPLRSCRLARRCLESEPESAAPGRQRQRGALSLYGRNSRPPEVRREICDRSQQPSKTHPHHRSQLGGPTSTPPLLAFPFPRLQRPPSFDPFNTQWLDNLPPAISPGTNLLRRQNRIIIRIMFPVWSSGSDLHLLP
jgi:hypothetical protein